MEFFIFQCNMHSVPKEPALKEYIYVGESLYEKKRRTERHT